MMFSTTQGVSYRPQTYDKEVIREVQNCYQFFNVGRDDVVMDVGGNIGAFALRFAQNVRSIHSYEPEAENFALLEINTKRLSNVKTIRAALVHTQDRSVNLFLNTKKNKASHSLYIQRGRQEVVVPARNFGEEVARVLPSAVKMDIEGGEYYLLSGEINPCIKKLCVEFHFGKKIWREGFFPQIVGNIMGNGFLEVREIRPGEKAWHYIAFFERA